MGSHDVTKKNVPRTSKCRFSLRLIIVTASSRNLDRHGGVDQTFFLCLALLNRNGNNKKQSHQKTSALFSCSFISFFFFSSFLCFVLLFSLQFFVCSHQVLGSSFYYSDEPFLFPRNTSSFFFDPFFCLFVINHP